jgi:hypothetical protein
VPIGPGTKTWLFEKGVQLTVWAGTVVLFALIPGYITEHGNLKQFANWSEEMRKTGEYSLVAAVVAVDALGKFVSAMLLKEHRRARLAATMLMFLTFAIILAAMADYTQAKGALEEASRHALLWLCLAMTLGFSGTILGGE